MDRTVHSCSVNHHECAWLQQYMAHVSDLKQQHVHGLLGPIEAPHHHPAGRPGRAAGPALGGREALGQGVRVQGHLEPGH